MITMRCYKDHNELKNLYVFEVSTIVIELHAFEL